MSCRGTGTCVGFKGLGFRGGPSKKDGNGDSWASPMAHEKYKAC